MSKSVVWSLAAVALIALAAGYGRADQVGSMHSVAAIDDFQIVGIGSPPSQHMVSVISSGETEIVIGQDAALTVSPATMQSRTIAVKDTNLTASETEYTIRRTITVTTIYTQDMALKAREVAP